MRKTSGALLMLAGLGLAVYAVFPDRKPSLAANDDFEIRLPQSAPGQADITAKRANVSMPSVAGEGPVAAIGQSALSTPAVVTVSPQHRSSVRLAVTQQPKSGVPTTDRSQLARELQRELRRVGCYDGEINGGWTTSTKRAMKTFTERVNASLPVEEPDLVLLTLVQGQADKTCGRPCPAGESAGEGGRCVPTRRGLEPAQTAAGHRSISDASGHRRLVGHGRCGPARAGGAHRAGWRPRPARRGSCRHPGSTRGTDASAHGWPALERSPRGHGSGSWSDTTLRRPVLFQADGQKLRELTPPGVLPLLSAGDFPSGNSLGRAPQRVDRPGQPVPWRFALG